jgi:ABC-type multidrug transport system fused ATPase/permease subunit
MSLMYVQWLWLGPLLIILALLLVIPEVGVSAVGPVGVMLLALAVQHVTSQNIGYYRRKLVQFSERRVKVTNELLQGIRVVKYYAWEKPMQEKVDEIREQEVANLTYYLYCKVVQIANQFLSSQLMIFTLLVIFVSTGKKHMMQ